MKSHHNTIQTWNQLAGRYQDRFMDLDLYDDTYDAFCDLIRSPDAAIFEIGCGPGNITRYLASRHPGYRIEAIDAAPGMIDLAKQNVPAAHFSVMDCREMHNLSGTYDGILCGFCMPYLSREEIILMIRECRRLLKPEGVFYCSVIEGNYTDSGYETSSDGRHSMFVHYYRERDLTEILISEGLDILSVYRKAYLKGDGSTSTHLIMMAGKPMEDFVRI